MTTTIPDDVYAILERAEINGRTVQILEPLDRPSYLRVKKVLEGLGGRWGRKESAHVSPGPAAPVIAQALDAGAYVGPTAHGFFPTPEPLARQLVGMLTSALDSLSKPLVLEPSAGHGALIHAVLRRYPEALIEAHELRADNAQKLRTTFAGSAVSVVEGDFIGSPEAPRFDLVVMNPPFEGLSDVVHVEHALNHLRLGGELVAIMSAGVMFRQTKRAQRFRATLDRLGARVVANADDAFRSSGTLVRTVSVWMRAR